MWHALPVAFEGDGRVERVRCDSRRRRTSSPIAGQRVRASTPIWCSSRSARPSSAKLSARCRASRRARVASSSTTEGATGRPGLFAGGDCANGGKEVVNAAAEGKLAARAIHQLPDREESDGRSLHQLRRHPLAESVLARLCAAGQLRASRSSARSTPAGAARCGRPSACRSRTCRAASAPSTFDGTRAHRLQQHRAHHRPPARGELPRDLRDQEEVPEARDHRVADGRDPRRVAGHHQALDRRRAPTASSSTSAAPTACASAAWARRSGRSPRSTSEITSWAVEFSTVPVLVKLTPERQPTSCRTGSRPSAAARTGCRSSTRSRASSASTSIASCPSPRVGGPLDQRRLLRRGGQAHRAAHGGRPRARPGVRDPDQRHRRRHQLARRGRVHAARLEQRAGVHRGDAPRLPHRRGHDRGPRGVHAHATASRRSTRSSARPSRASPSGATSISTTRPSRRSTPRSASAASCAWSRATTARTSASIRPRTATASACPWSTRASASAATCARSSARFPAASTWSRSTTASPRRPGTSTSPQGKALRPKKGVH